MPSTTSSSAACSATAAVDLVLVVFARPEEADVGVLDPQGGRSGSVRLGAFYITRFGSTFRMIASMTGFARREASGPWGSLVCELRSVNHRFLESGFRLPEELRALESELRQVAARGAEARQGRLHA